MQAILIVIFLTYFFTGFQLIAIAGYGVTLLDVSLLIFYFLIFKRLLWDGEKIKFSITPPLIFTVLLLGIVLLSGITPLLSGKSDWFIQFLKSSLHFYYLAGFAIICAIYPIEIKTWSSIIKMWIFLSVIINVFGIYQIFARAYNLPLAWIEFTNISMARGDEEIAEDALRQLSLSYGSFFRATSIFSEPSALGSFNSYILSFILVPIVFKFKNFIQNTSLLTITIILCAAGLLLTFSLTAFVGFAFIIFGFLLMQRIKNMHRFLYITATVFIIILAADGILLQYLDISVIELFTKRLEGIAAYGQTDKMVYGESFGGRLLGAQKAVEIWESYPIFGIGLGLTSKNTINNLEFSDFTIFSVLSELGILGFLAFIGLFLSLFWISVNLIKKEKFRAAHNEDELKLMHIVFFILIVQFIINFISGNAFIVINLWGPLAIVLSIINQAFIKQEHKVISIKLVKIPLKQLLLTNLSIQKKP